MATNEDGDVPTDAQPVTPAVEQEDEDADTPAAHEAEPVVEGKTVGGGGGGGGGGVCVFVFVFVRRVCLRFPWHSSAALVCWARRNVHTQHFRRAIRLVHR